MKWKIKTGDLVMVNTGAYKGVKGEILSVDKKKERIFVSGVNIVKRHKKSQNESGSIVEMESSIHKSNVSLFDPSAKSIRPFSKVGIKFAPTESRRKIRFFKKSGLEVR